MGVERRKRRQPVVVVVVVVVGWERRGVNLSARPLDNSRIPPPRRRKGGGIREDGHEMIDITVTKGPTAPRPLPGD